ncbi:MAG: DUF302 domain-containing protein [Thiohalomonas sp.]|nr:DUF302 domain-containing protein [Thiohalomonas sp.]
MKLIQTGLLLFLLSIALISHAYDGLVVKPSAYSVAETLDRMKSIMKKKEITIFTRINYAQGAKSVVIDLQATELLIFGNPKLGLPLMLSQPKAAIDLPLKAIVWKDKEGKVWLPYNSPDYTHDL